MKFTAEKDLPILEALAHLSPESSKTAHRSWLQSGRVTIDHEIIHSPLKIVQKGQVVRLGPRVHIIKPDIRVYYEDSHLIVVEKPEGLLTVSTAFEKEKTLHTILKDHFRPRQVFVVHRLDQDTSGVMLFALSEQARDAFKKIFEAHEIERGYFAIVQGSMDEGQGRWESYLYEDELYLVHTTLDTEKGRLAVTHYQVINKNKNYSALEIKLETGRKNQIRVHCAEAGFPVVGDKKYGSTKDPIKRLCLHAHILSFIHPITNKQMRFFSEVPVRFKQLVQDLD